MLPTHRPWCERRESWLSRRRHCQACHLYRSKPAVGPSLLLGESVDTAFTVRDIPPSGRRSAAAMEVRSGPDPDAGCQARWTCPAISGVPFHLTINSTLFLHPLPPPCHFTATARTRPQCRRCSTFAQPRANLNSETFESPPFGMHACECAGCQPHTRWALSLVMSCKSGLRSHIPGQGAEWSRSVSPCPYGRFALPLL